MKIQKLLLLLFLCNVFLIGTASALTFTSLTDLENHLGGGATLENFNGLADTQLGNFGSSSDAFHPYTGINGVRFQELGVSFPGAANIINDPSDLTFDPATSLAYDTTAYIRGVVQDQGGSGADRTRLRIVFDTPINYFGADFVAPSDGAGLQIKLNSVGDQALPVNSGVPIIPITLTGDGFFGFYSEEAFTDIIFETTGYDGAGSNDTGGEGFGLDNMAYAAKAVSEPATLLLLGVGLLGLAGISRKRIKK